MIIINRKNKRDNMDNIIQNIPIEDIIPIQIPNENEELKQLDELTESIKKYGIVEPLLVKEKDNKYEIIAGKKRYLVARNIGLSEIPVLIRNIDLDFYSEQKKETPEKKNKFINPGSKKNTFLPTNNEKKKNNTKRNESIVSDYSNIIRKSDNTNSDIINLSELNKKENERDELKMNNQEMNNQGVQSQNLGAPQGQTPTFGGRFFPSLEDEPTNMNMEGMGIIGAAMQNSTPVRNEEILNNNLIDLTDDNTEQLQPTNFNQEPQAMINPLEDATLNAQATQPNITNNEYVQQPLQQEYTKQEEFTNPQPAVENVAPVENFQNNIYDQPANLQMQNNYTNIAPQQENIQTQVTMNQPIGTPQFDMSQSMMTPNNMENQTTYNNQTMEQNGMSPLNNNIAPDFQQPIEQPPVYNNQPEMNMQVSNNNEYQMPIQQNNFTQPQQEYNQPLNQEFQQQEMNEVGQFPQKDVEPVINAIRSLANNLTSFGYNINIVEKDLSGSVKVTIEVQK